MSEVRVLLGPLMKDITFKKASVDDIEAFYPFFTKTLKALFPHTPAKVMDFYLETSYHKVGIFNEIAKDYKHLYLALHKKTQVGYLLTNKAYLGVGYAHWLAVTPRWQHTGIASQLLAIWEKEVLQEGGHALQLWTTNSNLPFYTNRGFIVMGEFPNAWFGMNNFMLYKTLRKAEEKNYLRDYLAEKRGTIKTS